jgi:DNA polymerase-1
VHTELPDFLTNPDPNIYKSKNYVVLDFETTTESSGSALDPRNRIVYTAWRRGSLLRPSENRRVKQAWKYKDSWASEFALGELVRDIQEASFIVAHNAKFELQWLERCGLDLSNVVVWDTMLAEYVIGGNRWKTQALSLNRCAKRRKWGGKMDVVSRMIKGGVCPSDIPKSWLASYCKKDVALTHRLFLDQLAYCEENNLLPVVYTRCLVTPVLADIEKNGMQLDGELVHTKIEEVEHKYAALGAEIDELTGGINLNSPKQLSEFIYETLGFSEATDWRGEPIRTSSGGKSTSVDTLALLKPRTKKQRTFIEKYKEYKGYNGELTKYLRKFSACVEHDGGLLQASFNQANTGTHRLSSTGTKYATQFHNFKRSYKPIFKARNSGWVVGEGDGAQLEFRAAGHLGRDRVALADIENGEDVHSVTADIIGTTRQKAKADTFKPLFGGKSGTPEQRRYYTYFREKYSGITETQLSWVDEVLREGSLVTEWGLRFYWPDTRMLQSGYVTNTTAICNYPIQSFATAEIIPISLVFFWHRLRRSDLRMFIVNTVHDSIIAEFPKEETNDFHKLSRQTLVIDPYNYLRAVYGVHLTVPLGAGVKVATHWGGDDGNLYVPDPEEIESWAPEGYKQKDAEVIYTADTSLYK